MPNKQSLQRYRHWYRQLLRCYSKPYRDRFAESMEQTFNDLCRERIEAGKGLFGFALWMFVETSAGILKENGRSIIMQNKIIRLAIATGCLLLVPYFAEAPWSLADFVFMGAMLFGTGLAYELVARKGGTVAYRVAVGLACVTSFLLVWINLAVGLIGSENNPANLLYAGVLAIGFLGAITARFQPSGMSLAMIAVAIAQALVPVIAFIIWRPPVDSGLVFVIGVNSFFVVMWLAAAILFRQAANPWPKISGNEREQSVN